MSPTRRTADTRIEGVRALLSPALLVDELPLPEAAEQVVIDSREDTSRILGLQDERLLVVVGPCSVHDPNAAFEYAQRLAALSTELEDRLRIVMRVYFEKPRSTLGWKGLINDPRLDGSYRVNEGLSRARKLLLDILELGMPVGCEFLDPITPQYIADAVTYGSIGARTAESQTHRQLSSGLSMPIGIKNSTDGDVSVAVDAIKAAEASHVFTGVTPDGVAAILFTSGNPDCHVILRGSRTGTNYDAESVAATFALLEKAGLPQRLLIDASHGNSAKDHRRQAAVVDSVIEQRGAGERRIIGIMLESFLEEGNQKLTLGETAGLTYGQSVTDACMDWETTVELLKKLAA